jgi:hypothetical protein
VTDRVCQGPDCSNGIPEGKRKGARFCSQLCYKRRVRRDNRKPRTFMYERDCAASGCDRPAKTLGYCNRHYENLRKYGDPIPRRDRDLDTRLREVGWTVTPSDCWEWNGKRNDNGYGIFNALRHGVKGERAHRAVYQHLTGETLPDDELLRHKCDNPPCVNPEHLIPGTHQDNSNDMVERRRHWMHGRTVCDAGHDLTKPGATRDYADGSRCVTCRRERTRRYEQRNIGRVS